MNITFDKTLKQRVYQYVAQKYDPHCIGCGKKITARNFGGALRTDDGFVFVEARSLPCLLEFSDHIRDNEGNDEDD